MSEYTSVEAYADHIRRTTTPLIGRLCHRLGAEHPVTLAVSELCGEADAIVEGGKMRRESSGLDRYDLAGLKVDANTASHSETPFENED